MAKWMRMQSEEKYVAIAPYPYNNKKILLKAQSTYLEIQNGVRCQNDPHQPHPHHFLHIHVDHLMMVLYLHEQAPPATRTHETYHHRGIYLKSQKLEQLLTLNRQPSKLYPSLPRIASSASRALSN